VEREHREKSEELMILNLAVQARSLGKKSELKNLRKSGLIPAVIYSEGQPGMNISVPTNEFNKLYRKSIGEVAVFNLTLNGNEMHAIVKDRQIHPVSRDFVHVDFM
jgi:large subunit ribosomal protein L25